MYLLKVLKNDFRAEYYEYENIGDLFERVIIMASDPTCQRLVLYSMETLASVKLPTSADLLKVAENYLKADTAKLVKRCFKCGVTLDFMNGHYVVRDEALEVTIDVCGRCLASYPEKDIVAAARGINYADR